MRAYLVYEHVSYTRRDALFPETHTRFARRYRDGAPPWACLNATIDKFPQYKRTILDKVGYDWRTVAALETFYDNALPADSSMGLQEHYIR